VHLGWNGPYDVNTTFHEPFVMFGFLAGVTSVELVTGVIILPQRQTALVAKQAVEVDLLTGGKFRLGVGVGWNHVEYEALGKSFDDRGRRMSEQVSLLRRLFSEQSVTEDGAYEQIRGAGLSPMPVQRPIPIWVGGSSVAAYRRMGRLADGWFPQVRPGPDLETALEVIAEAATAAGRDPSSIGMEGRGTWKSDDPEQIARQAARWRDAGASHLTIDTMRAGLRTLDDHIAALTTTAELVGVNAW
jgi:probable F420-dependent oxidoreductase